MNTIKVIAPEGLRCRKPGIRKEYIGSGTPVDVPNTINYRMLVVDGSLLDLDKCLTVRATNLPYAIKSNPANPVTKKKAVRIPDNIRNQRLIAAGILVLEKECISVRTPKELPKINKKKGDTYPIVANTALEAIHDCRNDDQFFVWVCNNKVNQALIKNKFLEECTPPKLNEKKGGNK